MITLVLGIGFLFFSLPFLPTLIEVIRRTDAAPLKISAGILKDPRSHPEPLFWHLSQLLNVEDLDQLKEQLHVDAPQSVGRDLQAIPSGLVSKSLKAASRLASAGDLQLQDRTAYSAKIYSFGSITTGTGNALHEIHAREELRINAKNKVVWWASAKKIIVGPDTTFPGKVQALTEISIQGNSRFHLMEAPLIQAGKSSQPLKASLDKHLHPVPKKQPDRRIKSAYIPADTTVDDSLVIYGTFEANENAVVLGDVKGHQNMVLKDGVQIHGNVVCMGNLVLGKNVFIDGSVLCKGNLKAATGCQFGTATHQVTVSAQRAHLQGAWAVHGFLRGWKLVNYHP